MYIFLPLTLKFSLFVSFALVLCDNAQCGTHMVLITTLSNRAVLGRACYRHVSPVIILGRSLRIDLLLIATVENEMAKITNFKREIVFHFFSSLPLNLLITIFILNYSVQSSNDDRIGPIKFIMRVL